MVKQNEENATVIKLLNEVKSLVENVPNTMYYRNKDLKRIFGFSIIPLQIRTTWLIENY